MSRSLICLLAAIALIPLACSQVDGKAATDAEQAEAAAKAAVETPAAAPKLDEAPAPKAEPAPVQLAQAAPAAPAPTPQPQPQPKPVAKPAPPKDTLFPTVSVKRLETNGSFEEWEKGVPKGWRAAVGQGSDFAPIELEKVQNNAIYGKASVAFPDPSDGKLVVLRQNLPPNRVVPERRLRYSMLAKAETKDQVHLVIDYTAGGQKASQRLTHPGGGIWRKLEGHFWVPKDADLGSFAVNIYRFDDAGSVWVDDVQVWVEQ